MLCVRTSIRTLSLPRPKWARTPLGKASVTPGIPKPDRDGSSAICRDSRRMLIGAIGKVVDSDFVFLLQ